MPIYVFRCQPCEYEVEEIRKVSDYNPPHCDSCNGTMEYILTPPDLQIWNAERKFPNVGRYGDGSMSFASKDAYERHLKDHHMAESSTDAPVKTPHGAEVTIYE
jgi:putative FmdB family regulatory protein